MGDAFRLRRLREPRTAPVTEESLIARLRAALHRLELVAQETFKEPAFLGIG